MNKELIITKEDIELLKEMKENCLKSSVYDDEKRLSKANAITKFLNLLDTVQKQKEVINKAINHINNKFLAQGGVTSYEWNDLLSELLNILKGVSE